MPPNLKPYYDAAVTADAEVQAVMKEIETAFGLGTTEGQEQALELRPKLDAAKVKAKNANELYISMRDASLTSEDMAANFTAVADPAADEAASKKKQMTRSAFEALEPRARMEFVQAGGKITENEVK